MTEKTVLPWIAVNNYMDDEYRSTVVELALGHLTEASSDLAAFAKQQILHITVAGFRSIDRAPVARAGRPVLEYMQSDNDVATAIICLWAEAKHGLVNDLRAEAELQGVQIHSSWSWQEAKEGFYIFEEIKPLPDIAQSLVFDEHSSDADHLQLAALWLGRALLSDHYEEVEDTSAVSEESATSLCESQEMPVEGRVTEYLGSLSSLSQALENRYGEVVQAQREALLHARSALTAIQELNPESAIEETDVLHESISNWLNSRMALLALINQALPRLSSEAETRPDLEIATVSRLPEKILDNQPLSQIVDNILSNLQSLLEYDHQKQEALDRLAKVNADIVNIHSDISHWIPDEILKEQDVPHLEDESAFTLTEAQQIFRGAEVKRSEFQNRRSQLRELSLNRISNQMDRLQKLDFSLEDRVWKDQTLEDLLSYNLTDWSSRDLWHLEQSLVDQVEEQALTVRSIAPKKLATDLQSKWEEKCFIQLLECLAEDKRDVEAFILLMSATAAHPQSEPMLLERSVVSSILRGLGDLSEKAYPFRLLSSLAPDFLNGWRAVDLHSQAELRMVFLAADYSGSQLPDGFLWQLTRDEWNWPIEEMRAWNKLWQSTLQGNKIFFVDEVQEEHLVEKIKESRSHAQQMMAHEAGRYVSLNSIRSHRHAAMLSKMVMPWLCEQLNALQTLDEAIRESDQEHCSLLLKRLRALVDEDLSYSLEGEWLEEMYEAKALEASLDDSDPFHRRTALRTIEECATAILKYGQSLIEFWQTKMSRGQEITQQVLQAELEFLSDLSSLGQAALDQIAASHATSEHSKTISVDHQLVEQLLGRVTFALRIPHTVGYLTTAALNWSDIFTHLLTDVAEGLDPEGAADVLLDYKAPSQALLLTKYLSLDMQKQAQELEKNQRKEVEEIYESLLQLGGEAQDLLVDRDLRRWQLVSRKLTARLEAAREIHEVQRQRRQTRAHQVRQAINELDMQLFEVKNEVPADVQQVIDDGLNLAREATREEKWFEIVEDYLSEIHWRLDRNSWPLAKLQEAYKRLEVSMEGGARREEILRGVEEVLSLLERGELEQLGLDGEIGSSKIRTRVSLLHNWLEVVNLRGFRSEDLRSTERDIIKNLYRYFAQMVVMDRAEAPTPLAFEEPIVHSHWRLRYHKVEALKRNCIFIALPGRPPSGKNLSELDHTLEDKEWLDYFYVFLFVPAVTPEQLNRLRSTYRGERLVIIDESAILDMVLAEAQSSKPLWRLRPLMLQAWGSEKADIFLVNQSISLRTGIFVGRDDLIQRIASSGSDYALYGGRRIGKSSVLKEVERYLHRRQDVHTIIASFEGDTLSDDAVARKLARKLQLEGNIEEVGDFKTALQDYLDTKQDSQLVLLLDEIDCYIKENPDRHIFIETLRALSEQYDSRFRVVIAGFMELYDCLRGRGPYSPASDPWGRMLDDIGPLPNLRPESAEQIVDEGFSGILGWDFEIPVIPQRIVQHTGGHPSFVQYFCRKLQNLVGQRRDQCVRLSDIDTIFKDKSPTGSFIAHVRDTLQLNLDPVGEFLIPWLAFEFGESQSFTQDQMRDLADLSSVEIPEELLARSLERLVVTKVVEERARQVYEFSVPDYPLILNQLGDTADLERTERKLKKSLEKETV